MADMEAFKVATLEEVPPGSIRRVEVGGHRLALFHVEGRIYATDDTCTHADASLAEGELQGTTVLCPLHYAEFDVETGRALSGPATEDLRTHPVEVRDGEVWVRVPRVP